MHLCSISVLKMMSDVKNRSSIDELIINKQKRQLYTLMYAVCNVWLDYGALMMMLMMMMLTMMR